MASCSEIHETLATQLVQLVVSRLVDPLEILLNAGNELREQVVARAADWADQLLGQDDELAVHTAIRLVSVLYTSDGPFDPPADWWRTPLGHVVARRVGHPATDAVSYSVAGAMLGITRQGVHDLIRRDKLDRHPDGGVTTASVRARLDRATSLSMRPARNATTAEDKP